MAEISHLYALLLMNGFIHNVVQSHLRWLTCLVLSIILVALLNIGLGDSKQLHLIDWLDVISEGGASLMVLAWILIIFSSRPAGRVTNFLIGGLLALFIALFQDAMDEGFHPREGSFWHIYLEFGLSIGMALITIALYLWRKEQLVINQQLKNRERLFREHTLVDHLTQISDINYLKSQLQREHEKALQSNQPFSLILLDINDFYLINREYGDEEGDNLLHSLCELLILNLGPDDLICRYAGDRFAVLLPNRDEQASRQIAGELDQAVTSFAYKTKRGDRLFLQACFSVVSGDGDSPEQILQRAKDELTKVKTLSSSGGDK
ncbi:GGDEF domain-containing protein [Teredinibacter sp. KSP-S5-2]|uniref:GGDEF domain-containing protein n=1 Tax=Teredinibacter sp. KSP-S5-2 TaxID=3034506 RepID=UPI002934E942|nr:diguanylate cyclase [Teredinibacter sp. KSP-S5-2]WNO09121.1 diguanylate cyclase [Teredinibacter sp. KSP-S5-2]